MKPVKYILIITAILLVLAFLFTLPGTLKNKENEETEATGTAAETTEIPVGGDPEMSNITDSNGNIIVDGDTTSSQNQGDVSSSQSSASGDETTKNSTPSHQNGEIDNEWSLFLVNNDNAMPEDYKFDTSVVFTASDNGKEFLMDSRAASYMISMIEDAQAYGAPIGITSAYRSVEYQKQNFDSNVKQLQGQGMTYEEAYAETAKNIAIPGKSEHNTGLAADILSGEHWSLDEGFENTRAFKWLSENCHKYGFILRYPKDKTEITKINYEPWHYRFVGIYHATKIWESKLTLEEYMAQME